MTRAAGPRGGVVCLGRTYCDILFAGLDGMPELGRERFARAVTIAPGGGAFITAAHLAARGRPALLASRLGLDALSTALAPTMAATGVDLRFVEHAADAGPQPTAVMIQGDERAFVSRRAGRALPATFAAALAAPGIRHLHIAEFATLDEAPQVLAAAKARGLTVSLDPSWDDQLLHDPGFLAVAAGVDLLLPNLEEARAVGGAEELETALARLAAAFPAVVVKCGGAGAVAVAAGRRLSLPAPRVAVVDSTGAGDAFNAGFLDAWLDGAGLDAALAAAIATGSASVAHAGGFPAARHPASVSA